MNLGQIHSVYFIGIGGIGMSALARWFAMQEIQVAGYDRTRTALSKTLEQEGMQIHYDDAIDCIPEPFREPSENILIIYTPAIPNNHKELCFFKENRFTIKKRAEVLGLLSKEYFTIAVAGTHGKTTTSSMIAHILKASGQSVIALLGGILQGYESNFIFQQNDTKPILVVEADEFDRSFLHLHPNMAIITSVEADHLDIYGQVKQLEDAFVAFAKKLPEDGTLITHFEIKEFFKNQLQEHQTYDVEQDKATYTAKNIQIDQRKTNFTWQNDTLQLDCQMNYPGRHNLLNMTAAIAAVSQVGITEQQIKMGVKSYLGVKRRFEYIFDQEALIWIDDYAHHPTEITALLQSVQKLYGNKKILAIFQPHLYSRTQDFASGFAQALSLADQVVLLPIYPARELPIEGVSSKLILDKITVSDKKICQKEALLDELRKEQLEVLVTIGAGDIDQLIGPISKNLTPTQYEI